MKNIGKKLKIPAIAILALIVAFAFIITLNDKLLISINIPNWSELTDYLTGGRQENKGFSVHYIDVGHGDCILLRSDNESMLIDAGKTENAKDIVSYLKKERIRKLDYVIITHQHNDHIGGMSEVFNNFFIGQLIMPEMPEGVTHDSDTYINLLTKIDRLNLNVKQAYNGMSFNLGEARVEIISDPAGLVELNDISVVAMVTIGENKFLFTGDIEDAGQKRLLDRNVNMKADVLKVSHHGSFTEYYGEFLDAVSPRYAVISVSAKERKGLPSKSTLKFLSDRNLKTYRTDTDGTTVFYSDGKNIWNNFSDQ